MSGLTVKGVSDDMERVYNSGRMASHDVRENMAARNRRENEMLRFSSCPTRDVTKDQLDMSSLDFSALAYQLDNDYVDGNVMMRLKCLFFALAEKKDVEGVNRLLVYIEDLRRFGEPSSGGIVAEGSFGNEVIGKIDKAVVIKGDFSFSQDAGHEYFVSEHGLNDLRTMIPSFAISYKLFECAPFVQSTSGKILEFCNNQAPYSFIMMENVHASSPLSSVMDEYEFDQVYNLVMQTFYALSFANKRNGFTHYDLHENNILVRPLPSKYNGKGIINFGGVRMLVTNVSTIIDYGKSYIKVGRDDYGIYGDENRNISPTSNILFDIFKLLMFMYWGGKGKNRNGIQRMLKASFFTDDKDVDDHLPKYLESMRKRYFCFPYATPDTFDVNEFLGNIRREFPEYEWMFQDDQRYTLLGSIRGQGTITNYGPRDIIGYHMIKSITGLSPEMEKEFSTKKQEIFELAFGSMKKLKDEIQNVDDTKYLGRGMSPELWVEIRAVLLVCISNLYILHKARSYSMALRTFGAPSGLDNIDRMIVENKKHVRQAVDYFLSADSDTLLLFRAHVPSTLFDVDSSPLDISRMRKILVGNPMEVREIKTFLGKALSLIE